MKENYKVSKKVLRDIYALKVLAERAYYNELNDVGKNRADVRLECYEKAVAICSKYTENNPPVSINS